MIRRGERGVALPFLFFTPSRRMARNTDSGMIAPSATKEAAGHWVPRDSWETTRAQGTQGRSRRPALSHEATLITAESARPSKRACSNYRKQSASLILLKKDERKEGSFANDVEQEDNQAIPRYHAGREGFTQEIGLEGRAV